MTHLEKLMKRNISLLACDLFMHAWNDKKLFQRMTGLDTYVSNFEFIENEAWFDMDWFDEVMTAHWNYRPEAFYTFTSRGEAAGERLVTFCREMGIENRSPAELETLFWRSAKLFQNLSVFVPVTHPLSRVVENKARAVLERHGVKEADMDRVLMEISVPKKLNGPEQEILELRCIKTRLKDPKFDPEPALREHWKKYSYLGYRELFSTGYSVDFFRKSLQEKDLSGMGKSRDQQPGFTFTLEEEQIINLLKEFVWFRNYRTEKFFEALFFLEPLWKSLSVAHGLGETDLFYYLGEEVSRLFTHRETVRPQEISLRKEGDALLLDDNRFILLTGTQLKQKETSVEEPVDTRAQEIRGMVVCRGEYRGPARVVLSTGELDKVNDGDVLVTGMTTPDYLPALRKASAFVTDEGGITCHAAIVARELKKPCIVGTKTATHILSDGLMVDVDANGGVVRILS